MTDITYQNDPALPDYCPDPNLLFTSALTEVGNVVKAELCAAEKRGVEYTDEQVAGIETMLEELTGAGDLTAKVAAIESLVNSLDTDGDGQVVDQLNDLLGIANAAKTIAEGANQKSDEAKAAALATEQALSSFQTTVNGQMTTVNGHIANHAADIAKLKSDIANMVTSVAGITAADVKEMICANNRKIMEGVTAGVSAFTSILQGACPVDPASDAPSNVL